MGRKPLENKEDRKENFTIRLPDWLIKVIRGHEGYSAIIENLLKNHFIRKKE